MTDSKTDTGRIEIPDSNDPRWESIEQYDRRQLRELEAAAERGEPVLRHANDCPTTPNKILLGLPTCCWGSVRALPPPDRQQQEQTDE